MTLKREINVYQARYYTWPNSFYPLELYVLGLENFEACFVCELIKFHMSAICKKLSKWASNHHRRAANRVQTIKTNVKQQLLLNKFDVLYGVLNRFINFLWSCFGVKSCVSLTCRLVVPSSPSIFGGDIILNPEKFSI